MLKMCGPSPVPGPRAETSCALGTGDPRGRGVPAEEGSRARGPEAPPTLLPVGKRCHRPRAAPAEPQGWSRGEGHPEGETWA